MEITAGAARGLKLADLPDESGIRPTSVRARRAFFDSIGNLDGIVFADLFAGSGAMGLEAASRGARAVAFAEANPRALALIRKNSERLQRCVASAEFHFLSGSLPQSLKSARTPRPDLIFADPPYADSMALLNELLRSAFFGDWAGDAEIYWELPDFPCPLTPPPPPWRLMEIRSLGSARFLHLTKLRAQS